MRIWRKTDWSMSTLKRGIAYYLGGVALGIAGFYISEFIRERLDSGLRAMASHPGTAVSGDGIGSDGFILDDAFDVEGRQPLKGMAADLAEIDDYLNSGINRSKPMGSHMGLDPFKD